MRKFNLLITPVGGIIVVVIMAFSAVAGIVANFVSNQQSDLPAQTAARIDELQRAVDQTSANVGDIPAFELKETPAAIPSPNEPDALIWWDATPEPPTLAPMPTTTPWPTPEVYALPTQPPPMAVELPRYQTMVVGGWVHVAVPGGWLPCHNLARTYEGQVFAVEHSWAAGWFNALSVVEQYEILGYCGG
jgi:hypothetical protein